MATVFLSPGVFTREQDFSVFASRIGLTRLGLVGLTLKGPAFEPIKIRSTDEFLFRFGGTNVNLELPYVANSFLTQSSELTITRVLGKEGYTDSPAWIIHADNRTIYEGSVTYSGMTFTETDATSSTVYDFNIVENTAMTTSISAVTTGGTTTTIDFNSLSGTPTTSDMKTELESTSSFVALGISIGDGNTSGITAGDTFNLSADTIVSMGSKSGSTLAIIRSKSEDNGSTFLASNETDVQIGNITGTIGSFTISGSTGPLTAFTNGITVSLDETRDDYIVKALGTSPNSGIYDIYVDKIFPHFVREANKRGQIVGINPTIAFSTEAAYRDFDSEYTNPITPYVVSQVIGGDVRRLFRFQSISDGNSANREIKISITNLDTVTKTFDVIVRDYNDTDETGFQTALERFRSVTLDPTQPNYIAREIGTTDEEYPKKSVFVTLDMQEDHLTDVVPGGFEGYELRETGISGTTAPDVYYKTRYFSGDTVIKTFLGVSEKGYTGHTASEVSFNKVISTVESDLFAYQGGISSGTTTINGFHMESTAPSGYTTGVESALSAYTKQQRKFTLVPAGGFDGWNKFKSTQTFTSSPSDSSSVSAIKEAIDTMANPEDVDINLFAIPGINYRDNEDVVKHALTTIEDRADALYIMDSPRVSEGSIKGTPEEVVINLQDTGIDSNYAATYWPWVQIEDSNTSKYVYVAPTVEVVRSIALTDNVAFPWFAPAGINRGTASGGVIRADIKLNTDQRDTLYEGRINPVATFVQQGVVIWGQKTLQVRQSALDRINVRRLLLQVRRLIAAASQTLLFEQNDQTLRDQFLSRVEPILLNIQNQRGLTAFKVVMDESNNTPEVIDRNMLVGKIQLKPTRTAEYIELTFQVLPTGANFEDF